MGRFKKKKKPIQTIEKETKKLVRLPERPSIDDIIAYLDFPTPKKRNTKNILPVRSVWKDGEIIRLVDTRDRERIGFQKSEGVPYDEDMYPYICYVACSEAGFTAKQLALMFFCSEPVIKGWMRKYPAFRDAYEKGVDDFDCREIEGMLKKKCTGYEYDEVTYEGVDGDGDKIEVRRVTKHVQPSDSSLQFYLTNRQPGRFGKTRRDLEEVGVNVDRGTNKMRADIEKGEVNAASVINILIQSGAVQPSAIGLDNTKIDGVHPPHSND